MRENRFQKKVIDELHTRFPGCVILKNDSGYLQGIPDLTVLYKDRWAMLETKRSSNAEHQNNQDYYVNKMNEMSYASFIFPENKEDVMRELQHTFGIEG